MKFILIICTLFAFFVSADWNFFSPNTLPCNGAEGKSHPNGGGFVASTAEVAETVYVGSQVQVCDLAQIFDQVKILDNPR